MQIYYQHLIIVLMIIFTSIAVVDRFTTNLFPMYLKHPQSPIFPDDWTATTFIVFAWIAGRELIVSSAFIYLLQCKCLANWIFENKPSWLIIDDIHITNKRLHAYIGWLAVALPVIIHSYLAFLPLVKYPTNKFAFHHQWMRPIDDETGFYVDNYKDHTVNLAINDLYALFVVTVCFMLLFPLSSNKRIRERYYTLANYTHLLAAALYAIELLRTPFTIHCWFFCGPIIVLYIMDRIYGIYWYRASNETKLVCKYNIDADHVALFLHVPNLPKSKAYLGDVYWLNCKQYVQNKEFAHPFTTFYNHGHDDIQSFLFSPSMRSFPSHRGHRFPIRTAEEHQHVSYDQMEIMEQPQVPPAVLLGIPPDLYLIRTDTARSGISVSGLAIQKPKLECSPSESVKMHAFNLQQQQQLKLNKLYENREPEHAQRKYSSHLVSPSAAAYMAMTADMKYASVANTAASSETETEVEEYAETEEEDEEESHKHHIYLKSVQTVIGAGSVSAFSLPAISYNHSENEASLDIMERETDHDEIEYKSVYTHHMQTYQDDIECKSVYTHHMQPSEDHSVHSSTATFKGGHTLNVSSIPKTAITRTDIDSVIKENIEVSYSQHNKKIQFGTLKEPKHMEITDDNLWLDENVEEEFGWNVAVIMKVKENGFTQYVADELGCNYIDTDIKSNSNKIDNDNCSDESFTNSFTDYTTNIYSYGPYRSSFAHIIDECFVHENPIVLIGTGAGVSYIVDFLLYARARNIVTFEARVDIHFSCRSVKLFQWITDLICGPTVKKQDNLYVNAHLTNHENINGYSEDGLDDDKIKLKASVGRMSFESVLRSAIVNTKVFFCGSSMIETQLIKLCNELRFKMYRAHCF